MYAFLLSMWVMGRINEAYLQVQVDRGRITQLEMDMIVVTPQIEQD